jgi:tetratricopeptide (TPR) repeat protein/predicted Ser/Thr protein kinase
MPDAARIAELVKSASEREPHERAAFVEEACAGDRELQAEVGSLLRFETDGNVFDKGALHLAANTVGLDAFIDTGAQIDNYRVISQIGVGGMGDVYLAEDAELQRKVALKLVRTGIGSDDIVARFRHEERILASLNHPNIAHLHGYGRTSNGTPFFVMEYVDGAPLTDFCQGRNLSIRERLALFQKVCAAVHYAHQHLVVHRDLKPSNILVTANGEPKLLDFGIAKLLENEDGAGVAPMTMTIVGVMTPEYASPEQVRGESITTASDIYSLGVILYELLTEQRPYRTKSRRPDEVARAVTDEQPPHPSTVLASAPPALIKDWTALRSDLDNIVLMALRKEPQRRYSSVAQFSDDIRRCLEGRPVLAHRDTFSYRAGKFVRRHKAALAVTAFVVAALCVAMAETLRQKQRAERRFNDVRQLANALLIDIAPKIERLEGSVEARQALVTQSLRYLDSLARESADDSALQSELAAAYEKVGALQGAPQKPNVSDYRGAIASYEKAQALRSRRLDDRENRRLLAANYRDVAAIRYWTNEFQLSLKDSEAALQLYEQLLAEQPHSRELRLAWAEANFDAAQTHSRNQHYAQAYEYLERPLATLEEMRRSGDDSEVLRLLGRGYSILGISLSWDGQQERAEAEMTKALTINEALVAQHPNDVVLRYGLWFTYIQASSLYEESGDPAKDQLSADLAAKSIQLAAGTLERDPANVQARQNLAQGYSKLAVAQSNLNQPTEAIATGEKALALFLEMERAEPNNLTYKRNLGILYTRFGDAKLKAGDLPGALDAFDKSIASFEAILNADPTNRVSRDIAQACKNVANIHRDLAATTSRSDGAAHASLAMQNYQRARDILVSLEAQGALPAFDRKLLDEMNAAVANPIVP